MWEGRAHDARPSYQTGIDFIDGKLFRWGFQPGTLVILGGRTHTRKTSVALNLIANMLSQGAAVGLVGLDETGPGYVAKLCSVLTGGGEGSMDAEWLETHWKEPEAAAARAQYRLLTKRFSMTKGNRPTFHELNSWLDTAPVTSARPEVVFIDYLALLARAKYSGSETNRIPQLAENLAVWAEEQQLVVIAIHQVSRQRTEKGTSHNGDRLMSLDQLKYGGEEMADVVLGTYRPALNFIGNLSEDDARAELGDNFKQDEYDRAVLRVQRYQDSTFLQLLKNRPSHKGLDIRGVELISNSASMFMKVRPRDSEDQEDRRAASS